MKQLRLSEMKELNPNWFEKGAMKFFNTKIEAQPNKANMFITSEYMEDPETKRYSIRQFDTATNTVETVGEFREFATLEEARAERTWRTRMTLGK